MSFKNVLAAIVVVLAFTGFAGAWGLPSALNTSTYSSADPDAFLEKSRVAEGLINKSSDSLFKAVASKEEQAKMEELQKKLNETTDDKEKNAIRQEITKSEQATIKERAADKELQKQAKDWDEKKKRQVSNAYYNFSLGAQRAALLVPEGTSIASSISSNPVNAARLALKLNSVYESLKSVKAIVGGTASVLSAMKPLMTEAKIEAKTPATATSAPVDAKDLL